MNKNINNFIKIIYILAIFVSAMVVSKVSGNAVDYSATDWIRLAPMLLITGWTTLFAFAKLLSK